jgi:hypothetical protein
MVDAYLDHTNRKAQCGRRLRCRAALEVRLNQDLAEFGAKRLDCSGDNIALAGRSRHRKISSKRHQFVSMVAKPTGASFRHTTEGTEDRLR